MVKINVEIQFPSMLVSPDEFSEVIEAIRKEKLNRIVQDLRSPFSMFGVLPVQTPFAGLIREAITAHEINERRKFLNTRRFKSGSLKPSITIDKEQILYGKHRK